MHALQQQRQPARSVPEHGGEVQELHERVWVQYRVMHDAGTAVSRRGLREKCGMGGWWRGRLYDMQEGRKKHGREERCIEGRHELAALLDEGEISLLWYVTIAASICPQ